MDELNELAALGSTNLDLNSTSISTPDKENVELTEEEMQEALSSLNLNKKGNRLTRSPKKEQNPRTGQNQKLTNQSLNQVTNSDSDDEGGVVPLQLLTEFLQCVMSKDWRNALKLCNYILMYEKDHVMANQYSPMLRRAVMEFEEGGIHRKSDAESEADEDTEDSEESDETDSDNTDSESEDEPEEEPEEENSTTNNSVYGISLDLARNKAESASKSTSKSSPNRSGWVP
jgi:hypothetical protein